MCSYSGCREGVKYLGSFSLVSVFALLQPFSGSGATNCAAPPSGLVSWWAAEGDASDQTGLNPGMLQGAADFDLGEVGTAFAMHGGTDAIKIAASASLNVGAGSGLT